MSIRYIVTTITTGDEEKKINARNIYLDGKKKLNLTQEDIYFIGLDEVKKKLKEK